MTAFFSFKTRQIIPRIFNFPARGMTILFPCSSPIRERYCRPFSSKVRHLSSSYRIALVFFTLGGCLTTSCKSLRILKRMAFLSLHCYGKLRCGKLSLLPYRSDPSRRSDLPISKTLFFFPPFFPLIDSWLHLYGYRQEPFSNGLNRPP